MRLPFDPKVIILTGAGASVPLKKPTTVGFLELLKADVTIDQTVLQAAIAATQRAVGSRPTATVDIESLLDHISSFSTGTTSFLAEPDLFPDARIQDSVHKRAHDYSKLREQILQKVVETYGEVDPSEAIRLLHPLVWGLARALGLENIPVFTLNYDLAFETYADAVQPQVEIIDGFDRSPSRLIRAWARDTFEKSLQTSKQPSCDCRLVLFKLHGSANWGRDSQTRELQQIGFVPKDTGRYETVVHYPSLNEKPTYQEPFQTAFDFFLAAVKRAETILIIGTSFRDKAVADILRRVRYKVHIVVNNYEPVAAPFVEELQKLGAKISYIAGSFDEAHIRYMITDAAVRRHVYGYFGPEYAARLVRKPLPIFSIIPQAGLCRLGRTGHAIVLDGDIVTNGNSPDAFLIVNGQRKHIPDIPTMDALGFSWNGILRLPSEAFDALPESEPIQPILPDGMLLQKPGTPDIFLVSQNCLCHIVDLPTLEVLLPPHISHIGDNPVIYRSYDVRKDVSADTFRMAPHGPDIGADDFQHQGPTGELLDVSRALESILSFVESHPHAGSYHIQNELKFRNPTALNLLLARLTQERLVNEPKPNYGTSTEQNAVRPMLRLHLDSPYDLVISQTGKLLLDTLRTGQLPPPG